MSSRPHVVRAEATIETESDSLSAVDYDELARRIEDGDTSMVLVNVLPRAVFEAERIPGSVNLPLDEIAERVGEVLPARDQETVVYCASPASWQGVALDVLHRPRRPHPVRGPRGQPDLARRRHPGQGPGARHGGGVS